MKQNDKSQSEHDPAGLFSKDLVPSVYPSLSQSTPADDNHRTYEEVYHLNQLHKANNCNNCKRFEAGMCKIHKYSMPYREIDCEQWEYRNKKV